MKERALKNPKGIPFENALIKPLLKGLNLPTTSFFFDRSFPNRLIKQFYLRILFLNRSLKRSNLLLRNDLTTLANAEKKICEHGS